MLPRPRTAHPLAALALLLLGCGSGAGSSGPTASNPDSVADTGGAATAAVPQGAPLVVFLGDSIAAGLHVDEDQAFPAVVQRLLAEEGVSFRLVNAGVSGDTSAGGLRRLDWLLKQEPAVLVVELGGNDGLRGQPVAEIEERLRAIVTRARAAGVRVLLLGVVLPPSLGQDYASAFQALYPRLAQELDCAFVPFFMQGAAGDPAKMNGDGIHPNAAGHEALARNVAPALRALLEGEPAAR